MNFPENIRQWVAIDNEIKTHCERIKELRNHKSRMTNSLIQYMTQNNIQNKVIKINEGKLKVNEVKVHEPLTFRYLQKQLELIIDDKSNVNDIMQHLKASRQFKIIKDIKRVNENEK